MRPPQPDDCSSSDEDKQTDIESCFDTDEDSGSDTNLTDDDTDTKEDDEADLSWLYEEDEDYPPEYYIKQQDDFDESEFASEDYSAGSTNLLDRIEERWCRYCKYTGRDAEEMYENISLRVLYSFFDWVLNQRRGKGGRKLRGTKTSSSLGNYWKFFRLVYESKTGSKIDTKVNKRQAHRMLRKLAKKHGLSNEKREKTVMYVEDLVEIEQTNLTTTKKKYSHGRHRIQVALFLQLAGFSANRPQALLDLCYRHIMVTLLRDPEGGPHRILLEFTYEFTKEFLGSKDANTFPIPEIIFDPSLVLSPHVTLLGLLLADKAFAAPNLTSAEQLSLLDIEPGCNQLQLLLNPEKDNIPVFRKSVQTLYGSEISPDKPLPYATLTPWIKRIGVLTAFPQVARPYCLRYGAGNAFNQSGDVSEALQNLMMQHANMRTFINHYLSRRVTVDTQAIVRGLDPQYAVMRAACRMSRWIDPGRPQELTGEQPSSVNQHPRLRRLIATRDKLKHHFNGRATAQPAYQKLGREIAGERQRQRSALLRNIQGKWDQEQPVRIVERQLAGEKFSEDVKATLELSDDRPPEQKRLIETIMTLPGTTLEEEVCRRSAAINAVAAYCKFEEGGARGAPRKRPSTGVARPIKTEGATQPVAADPDEQALNEAMLSVFQEKRPTICFICLGRRGLPVHKRVYSFASPGDLSKHFKRKHLTGELKEGQPIECNVCQMTLMDKMHLQNHAQKIHGTVS